MSEIEVVSIRSGTTTVVVSPSTGGISSLRAGGIELLYPGAGFGSFPMAPWCGRLRDGLLKLAGQEYQFPQNEGVHSIHGTAHGHRWEVVEHTGSALVLAQDLSPRWPFGGRVTQRFAAEPNGLALQMSVSAADASFPAQVGWHPWFRRELGDGTGPLRVTFNPAWQLERGEDYLPTGRQISPLPQPWDDCFGMPDGVDVLCEWPGGPAVRIRSDAQWVVIYDERDYAVCVEPQSGPPNGLNTHPQLVAPGTDLVTNAHFSW